MSQIKVQKITNLKRVSIKKINSLRQLVEKAEEYYPGIDMWFERKVIPGLKDSSRMGLLAMVNGEAVGGAIIKLGANTKICSLRVDDEFRDDGVGSMLFSAIAREIPSEGRKVHFTAPEEIAGRASNLFSKFGFLEGTPVRNKYRKEGDEFYYEADTKLYLQRSIRYQEQRNQKEITREGDGIIISIHPKYAYEILGGRKRYEIRKRFSEKRKGSIAYIYATSPIKKYVGHFIVGKVVKHTKELIYALYCDSLGATKDELYQYAGKSEFLYAIEILDPVIYSLPKSKEEVVDSLGRVLDAPLSYKTANKQLSDQINPYLYNQKVKEAKKRAEIKRKEGQTNFDF